MQLHAPVQDALRRRAEAEYREMPGLKLTAAQAARLWHLGAAESARLLESMVDAGLLYRARDGSYLLLWNR
jgi:DNA-binding IclR family transcriptional regulator